jgi:hypothetical protein
MGVNESLAEGVALESLGKMHPALARRLLAFDWWIHNRDRTRQAKGPSQRGLAVFC